MVELADFERQRAGQGAPFAPNGPPWHAGNRFLAIDVDAVESAAPQCTADRSEMREQVGVLDDHRKCFGHEDRGVEGTLGDAEFFDRAAVEAKMLEAARLRAA